MLNRKESKILIMQRKSAGLLAVVSVAMLSVGFAGTGALSASANNAPVRGVDLAPAQSQPEPSVFWIYRSRLGVCPRQKRPR